MAIAYSVESAQALLFPSKDGHLVIHVLGTVTSGGWSGGILSPYVYTETPIDGIWDFSLEATPPTGMTSAVITPITACAVIPNPPDLLKGVRVHASVNRIEAMLPAASILACGSGLDLLWSGDLPWPDVLRANGEGIIGNG